VSNSQKDNDWGDDSAALFRGARRAHDPTPADRMAINRVLTRIQAATTAQPSAAMGPARASRGASPVTLLQIGKVSLAVLGVAAAYLAFSGADRDPSSAPNAAAPASSSQALPNPAPPAEPDAIQPTAPPRADPDDIQPSRVARREGEPPVRGTPRRSRASTGRQRPSQSTAMVMEAPTSTARDGSASASQEAATQADGERKASTSSRDASTREPARRQTSPEPSVQPPEGTAARAATSAPQEAGTELAVLKRMQSALRTRDFTTALSLCAEHERRWPHGRFELEREGVRAIASCGVSSNDALSLAKRFLATHPHSSLALRVSSACERRLQPRR
jgi:hypothetical protein